MANQFSQSRLSESSSMARRCRQAMDAQWAPFSQTAVNSPYQVACNGVCELLNSFPTNLVMWGTSAIDQPVSDLLFGVRPVLHAILRHEFLGVHGIRICRDEQCGRMFQLTHGSQQYCPDRDCERQQRQRRYWAAKGAETRRRRIAKKKGKGAVQSEVGVNALFAGVGMHRMRPTAQVSQ